LKRATISYHLFFLSLSLSLALCLTRARNQSQAWLPSVIVIQNQPIASEQQTHSLAQPPWTWSKLARSKLKLPPPKTQTDSTPAHFAPHHLPLSSPAPCPARNTGQVSLFVLKFYPPPLSHIASLPDNQGTRLVSSLYLSSSS